MKFFRLYLFFITFLAHDVCISAKLEEVEKNIITAKQGFGVSTVESLKELAKQFDSLQDNENDWQVIANTKGLQKKSEQSWKEAVGARLFFPKELIGALDSIYTKYLLQRNDIIWSLAIAAKYKDPVGEYYLSRSLSSLYWEYEPYTEIPDSIKNMYFHSMKELEKTQNPEDIYIRAYEYSFGDLCFNLSERNLEKAEELYNNLILSSKSDDITKARTEFDLLEMKRIYSYKLTKYKNKSYKKIGEKYSFGKAYWRSGILKEDLELLKKAVADNTKYKFYPAYIDLGFMNKDETEAKKYFNSAYKNNITEGKISSAELTLGTNIINKNSIKNLKASVGEKEKFKRMISFVTDCFKDAGINGNPSGWEYLADLYKSLYSIEKKNEYLEEMEKAIEENLKLGSLNAYKQLTYLKKEKQEKMITKYGKSPQETLYKDIENFINPQNRNEN